MTPHDEIDLQVAELLADDPPGAGTYEAAAQAHRLARELAASGRVDEAAALYRRAIAIKQEVLGPSDPEVASTLHNLALLFKAAGRAEEAESIWAEARAVLNA